MSGAAWGLVAKVDTWTPGENGGDLRLAGHDSINLIDWLAVETTDSFKLAPPPAHLVSDAYVSLSFASLDDAFRFKMRFDDAILQVATA